MTERNLAAFQEFFKESRARLTKECAAYNRALKKDKNPIIRVFKQDFADLNEGGKMLRGMLVNLGYRIAGGEDLAYSDALALAFEIFQTSVLIHDDIIDNAETRRGKYTIGRRYEHRLKVRGTKMVAEPDGPDDVARSAALCVGDLGLYLANVKLAEAYREHPAFADLILYFDDVIVRTIRGELLDVVLPYELQDISYSEEEGRKLLEKSIREIYHLKTACYSVIGPLHLGMMLGGAKEEDMRALDRFADDVGIAYQIMDDILGIYAEAGFLGKDVGSDISEFKQTILYMYVMNEAAPEYKRDLLKVYGKAHVTEPILDEVRKIFDESGAYDYAKDAMRACFLRAERRLSRMKFLSDEDRAILRGFLMWCQGRRK